MIKKILIVALLSTGANAGDRYSSKEIAEKKNIMCFVDDNKEIYKQLHGCIKSLDIYDHYILNFNGAFSFSGKYEGESIQGDIIKRPNSWVKV